MITGFLNPYRFGNNEVLHEKKNCFVISQSFHIIYDQTKFMLSLISLLSITHPQASNRWEKISTHGQKNQHAVEI